MKKLLKIVAFLVFFLPFVAKANDEIAFSGEPRGSFRGETGSHDVYGTTTGGGSLTSGYYYASGKTDTSFATADGEGDDGSVLGSTVVVGGSGSGNVDKLGFKVNSHNTAEVFKICLRNASTGACLAACNGTGDSTDIAKWIDCTLGTPYGISNGNYIVTFETTGSSLEGYTDAGVGQSGTLTWTDTSCHAWTPADTYGKIWGTRLHVQ